MRFQILLLVILLAANNLHAQGDAGSQLPAFNEKLFVHTDKNFYVTGEIIWFKLYACNNFNNTPDSVSKVAYIELLAPGNKPVWQGKVQVTDGSGDGSIQLSTSLSSGNYILRAYTNWMKNFSPDGYFYSPISIVNTFKSEQFNATSDTTKYDLQFFPESGKLISGFENTVGFKITNVHGLGVTANGSILDDNNNILASFSTFKFGMGSFSFTPKAGTRYHASVSVASNNINVLLPEQEEGYLLHVDIADPNVVVVSVHTNYSDEHIAYLEIQNKQGNKDIEPISLQNNQGVATMGKGGLADGVTTLTLLNAARQPVCERLLFKQPAATSVISTATDKFLYTKRDKVTLDITSSSLQAGHASISVFKTDSLQSPDQNSIKTYLWLASEVRGSIESPEYYFSATNADVERATDNLMLTQGWRKFVSADSAFHNAPYFPEYEGHIIAGKVTDKRNNRPASNISTYLSVPSKNFRFAAAVSDKNGLIRFNVPDFVGSEEIVLQTNNQSADSNYRVEIFNPFSDRYADYPLNRLQVDESLKKQLLHHSINSQLLNTYNAELQNQFVADNIDTFPFFGKPDKEYFLDDYTRFTTMEEVLREYVPEIAPRKHRSAFHIKIANQEAMYFDGNPLVLADGVPFFNMDTVMAFDPLKIKSLSVVNRRYFFGPTVFYGIMSYSTYRGDLDGIRLDPNSVVVEYDGMQLQRQFYAPKYETDEQRQNHLPDFRTTLYWLPDLILDSHQKKELNFFTSDAVGDYIICINGLTSAGDPLAATLRFKVQ